MKAGYNIKEYSATEEMGGVRDKVYYKILVIKTVCYWSTKQNRKFRNKADYLKYVIYIIFPQKGDKEISLNKSFWDNCKAVLFWATSYIIYQNKFQIKSHGYVCVCVYIILIYYICYMCIYYAHT